MNTNIKSERFAQLRFTAFQLFLKPKQRFQIADNAAITIGEEYETQISLNAFTARCSRKSFGGVESELYYSSSQILPKLYLSKRLIPVVKVSAIWDVIMISVYG